MFVDLSPGNLSEPLTGRTWDRRTIANQIDARMVRYQSRGKPVASCIEPGEIGEEAAIRPAPSSCHVRIPGQRGESVFTFGREFSPEKWLGEPGDISRKFSAAGSDGRPG